jgi:hypothetical protein
VLFLLSCLGSLVLASKPKSLNRIASKPKSLDRIASKPKSLKNELCNASSLKQQFAGRHGAPFGHIILIPSQPVFALSSECCMLSGEATNTNFIFFGLTRPGLEPTIYHINHYSTNPVGHDFDHMV